MTYKQLWGNRIELARRALQISQSELARQCHVKQQTISSIEAGKSAPNDELKVVIAKRLHQKPDQLFSLEVVSRAMEAMAS